MYSREALLKEVKKIVDDCASRRADGSGDCAEAAAVSIDAGGTGGPATLPLSDTYPAESAAAGPQVTTGVAVVADVTEHR
jgi:hypothetical protein